MPIVYKKGREATVKVRAPSNREERLAGIFVVLGATVVFAPLIWLIERWNVALLRDPANTWGARWLGQQLPAHPYLTAGALLFGVALSSGLVMVVQVVCAKRLAARIAGRAESGDRGTYRDTDRGTRP